MLHVIFVCNTSDPAGSVKIAENEHYNTSRIYLGDARPRQDENKEFDMMSRKLLSFADYLAGLNMERMERMETNKERYGIYRLI